MIGLIFANISNYIALMGWWLYEWSTRDKYLTCVNRSNRRTEDDGSVYVFLSLKLIGLSSQLLPTLPCEVSVHLSQII